MSIEYTLYKQIIVEFKFHHRIPYYAQLTASEWNLRRQEIINRDNAQCKLCNDFATEFLPEKPPFHFYSEDSEQEVYDEDDNFTGLRHKIILKAAPKAVKLHVHHKYYVGTLLPWEYPSDALITLCQSCHFNLHKVEKIPFYRDTLDSMQEYLTPCSRCGGAGHLAEYHYHQGGICFRCDGAMYDEWITKK